MDILIPSSNRPHKQTTFDNLPPELKERAKLVIHPDQDSIYRKYPRLLCPAKGIGPTRQWMIDNHERVLMLDDDLVFYTRRDDDPTKFRTPTGQEMVDLMGIVDQCMDEYAHGGIGVREGGNRNTEPYLYNTRALRALFYRCDILRQRGIRFDDMEVMEDFHVTLSLLRAGHPNVVVNFMVQNQNGSDLPGGCSEYRTREVQATAAHELARRHPGFVTVVQKETKGAWGGGVRTDVRVAWKKAYESRV